MYTQSNNFPMYDYTINEDETIRWVFISGISILQNILLLRESINIMRLNVASETINTLRSLGFRSNRRHIDGSVQDYSNSTANALELL